MNLTWNQDESHDHVQDHFILLDSFLHTLHQHVWFREVRIGHCILYIYKWQLLVFSISVLINSECLNNSSWIFDASFSMLYPVNLASCNFIFYYIILTSDFSYLMNSLLWFSSIPPYKPSLFILSSCSEQVLRLRFRNCSRFYFWVRN